MAKKRRMDQAGRIADLRERIGEIDRKYAHRTQSERTSGERQPRLAYLESWLGGGIVHTGFGCHFETEKLYERHRYHGSADIGALSDLPHDLLDRISGGTIPAAPPQHWAFLDTETTGIRGDPGTCAFLVGVGRITPDGFRVRQFFMRSYSEEASLLDSLARYLEPFRVLVTYNGRTFDQPLLEARYRLQRRSPPFPGLSHLDLLVGARRLWKLRFDSCRLVDLENQILGVERQGDLPGALIPYVYFEYLRTRQAARLLPLFQHNVLDIVTLACLTGSVPYAFRDPEKIPFRHGAELAGIARWLMTVGEVQSARDLLRRAVDAGLPDALLFPSLWELGRLERKLGAMDSALGIWTDLAASPNPFQTKALEELAKHHEHRSKDHGTALAFTRAARDISDSQLLEHREIRLRRRLAARDKI
jgi:uncharacterized protein YprB with RNaseH-like and TPR domain